MADREKLIELVEESFADQHDRRRMLTVPDTVNHLLANGVVVREKGEWLMNRDGSCTCKRCRRTTKDAWDFDGWMSFCPNCGADMRKGENGWTEECS